MLFPTISKFPIFSDLKSLVTGHPGNDANFNAPWTDALMDRYIFRHRFLCFFYHDLDPLSNGIKFFDICQFWFWCNFCVCFGPVFFHFQALMRLQNCYTADSWYVHDNETLETKIAISSNMGTLSAFITHPILEVFKPSSRTAKEANKSIILKEHLLSIQRD